MAILLGLVTILIVIAILIVCLKFLLRAMKYLTLAAIGIYLLPGLLLGFAAHQVGRWLRTTWLAQPLLALTAPLLSFGSLALGEPAWALAYAVTCAFAIGGVVNRVRARKSISGLAWHDAAAIIMTRLDAPCSIAFWLVLTGFASRQLTGQVDATVYVWLGWGYWIAALCFQIYAAIQYADFARTVRMLERRVAKHRGMSVSALTTSCKEAATLITDEIDELVKLHVAAHAMAGTLVEVEISNSRRLYASHWYNSQLGLLRVVLAQKNLVSDDELGRLTKLYLGLDGKDGLELLTQYAQIGARYQLADGYFFVSFAATCDIETCVSCGIGRQISRPKDVKGEWFCSDVCRATEATCLDIHRQAPESFIADSVAVGITLVSASDSWIRNHKAFATGGQGHGIAAEYGNTYVDRFTAKLAKVVGGDNAKNGADRLVNGTAIQTKYCSTPGRSVGAAFDGQRGPYRYYNGDGTPMCLEVPRDQYDKAVGLMRQRIVEGRVPGVSDPDKAVEIVKRGSLKYEHAQNIVKFGRLESLTYDAAEGAIAGVGAASISFCISSTLVYVRTGDASVAVQAAALQAGKAGLTTAVSYVATQQLHRVEVVQSALSHIDVCCLSPTLRDVLKGGFGVTSNNALNHALRGAVVTAVVSVAVSSGPDLYKLIRKEITAAKLKRTVAKAASGVVGGVVGSVAGGAVGSMIGPFGTWAGRFIGGTVGSIAVAALVDCFFSEQKEREREAANQLFRAHLEHLAVTFALTPEELRCVVRNFLRLSSEDMHQRILAGKNHGRPYLNSVLKPLVVGVVKQRDYLALAPPATAPLLVAA